MVKPSPDLPRPPGDSLAHLDFSPASESVRRRLFQQALLACVGMVALLWWSSSIEHTGPFFLGAVICVLAMIPAIIWTRTMNYSYPFFEIFIATNVTSYGIPLLTEQDPTLLFGESVREGAALAVALFLLSASLAYYATRGRPPSGAFWSQSVLDRLSKRSIIGGLGLTTVYSFLVPRFFAPPSGIDGILRAVFFGIGTSCTFIISVAWGRGQLHRGEQALVVLALAAQFLLLSCSLILRSGASVVLLGFVGYFFGARRIPYVPLLATVAIIALLNIGKYDLRSIYWGEDYQRQPTLTELPAFYWQWMEAGLHPSVQKQRKAGSLLLERTSLMQVLCLVVSRSPDYLPFLYGKTYEQIPGQFIPRLFWPEKPRGHLSTYTLSIYYGLQNEEATETTTIAFGFLPEAYANFGYWGVIGFGAVVGFCFRKVTLWSAQSPIFSYAGLLLILLTAWSFQTELTLSAWLSSLFQGAVSIFAFVFVFRRFQEISR
jgi:hypothetical protein